MFKSLLKKEFKALYPYLILIAIFPFINLLDHFLNSRIDQYSWISSLNSFTHSTQFDQFIYLFLAFSMAHTVFTREFDNKTIRFLDALPISRNDAFLAKIIMILAILLSYRYMALFVMFLKSFGHNYQYGVELYGDIIVNDLFSTFVFIFSVVSISSVLTYLRRFSWVLIGLIYWIYDGMFKQIPSMAMFNPFNIIKTDFRGNETILYWDGIIAFSIISVIFLYIGRRMYSLQGESLSEKYLDFLKKRIGTVVIFASTIIIIILGFSIMSNEIAGESPESSGIEYQFNEWEPSYGRSKDFIFRFPSSMSEQVEYLAMRADSLKEDLSSLLGYKVERPIYVDMLQTLDQALGTANWQSIQIDMATIKNKETLLSVFGHELTHVYLDEVSDYKMRAKFNSTRFFHEGVSEYIQLHFFEDENKLNMSRLQAAIFYDKVDIDFDEFLDNGAIMNYYDNLLVYYMGEVFIHSIVEIYDIKTFIKLAESFNRPVINNLSGVRLWRDAFQSEKLNFDRVISRFYQNLSKLKKQHSQSLKALKKIKYDIDYNDEIVQIFDKTELEFGSDWEIICQVRTGNSSKTYPIAYFESQGFQINRAFMVNNKLGFQLGYKNKNNGIRVYMEWQSIDVEGSD